MCLIIYLCIYVYVCISMYIFLFIYRCIYVTLYIYVYMYISMYMSILNRHIYIYTSIKLVYSSWDPEIYCAYILYIYRHNDISSNLGKWKMLFAFDHKGIFQGNDKQARLEGRAAPSRDCSWPCHILIPALHCSCCSCAYCILWTRSTSF